MKRGSARLIGAVFFLTALVAPARMVGEEGTVKKPRHAARESRRAAVSAWTPLSSETVGAVSYPVPQTVVAPATSSLTIDGDFDLGGFVFKGGVPFLHNDGGAAYNNTALGLNALVSTTPGVPYGFSGRSNTALGEDALRSNTTGSRNTATGHFALYSNTTSYANTASGFAALSFNTTGSHNTATGNRALSYSTGSRNTGTGSYALSNSTGSYNTAVGYDALYVNGSGSYNSALGYEALYSNTTGSRNTAVGNQAGWNATTGNDNIFLGSGAVSVNGETNTIRIGGTVVGSAAGQQNRTFINGIYGVTVSGATHYLVIDPAGQVGSLPIVSSRRYKKEIRDMGEVSERLLELRPVTFRFKEEFEHGDSGLQFGLIAEEVAEVLPELVVYDGEGRPQRVDYRKLSPLLLNELQRQARRVESQARELKKLRRLEAELAELRRTVGDLRAMEAVRQVRRTGGRNTHFR